MDRDSKYKMIDIAYTKLENSKCKRRKFGAVLCDLGGQLIGVGYNRAPDNKECNACARQNAVIGAAYGNCPAGHAEMYAILDALADGQEIDNGSMFVAGYDVTENTDIVAYNPCFNCAIVLALHNIDVYGINIYGNIQKWDRCTIYSRSEPIARGAYEKS